MPHTRHTRPLRRACRASGTTKSPSKWRRRRDPRRTLRLPRRHHSGAARCEHSCTPRDRGRLGTHRLPQRGRRVENRTSPRRHSRRRPSTRRVKPTRHRPKAPLRSPNNCPLRKGRAKARTARDTPPISTIAHERTRTSRGTRDRRRSIRTRCTRAQHRRRCRMTRTPHSHIEERFHTVMRTPTLRSQSREAGAAQRHHHRSSRRAEGSRPAPPTRRPEPRPRRGRAQQRRRRPRAREASTQRRIALSCARLADAFETSSERTSGGRGPRASDIHSCRSRAHRAILVRARAKRHHAPFATLVPFALGRSSWQTQQKTSAGGPPPAATRIARGSREAHLVPDAASAGLRVARGSFGSTRGHHAILRSNQAFNEEEGARSASKVPPHGPRARAVVPLAA